MRTRRTDVHVFRTQILQRSCNTKRVRDFVIVIDFLFFRYVELLENRVEILETGLREALLQLNVHGGIRLPHSPSSEPLSPTAANYLDHATDLHYNITQALKELQAMKSEREKGIYSENDHDSDHSDHGESPSSRRDSAESSRTASSAKTEELTTPITSPSNSPPQKALFLPNEVTQTPFQMQFVENNIAFYQPFYDRNITTAQNLATQFNYEDPNMNWLDTVALDDTYDLSLQMQGEYSFTTL